MGISMEMEMVSNNINIFGSNAALHAGQSIKVRCKVPSPRDDSSLCISLFL